jgi:mRNA interferase RelE/StbE
MRLAFEKQAARMLRRMPRKAAEAIRAALDAIAADPFARHRNVERLEGFKDGFRLRHGDWRAVDRLDREEGNLVVELIKPRGEVYKR